MLEMNLQLFAEEEEVEEQEETQEQEQEEEQEEASEETEETEEEQEEVDKKPAKNDSVPLSKYLTEKKRRQEVEKLFAQQASEREKLQLREDFVRRGYPDEEADYLAGEKVKQKQRDEQVQSKLVDMEIKDLARGDSFYADAESFKDEIKEKMREKGVDAEEAYMLIRGKARVREVKLEEEQRNLAQRRKTTTKKVENAPSSAAKNPYPLDDADKKALAGLQKMSPDAQWNVEKYYKLMKSQ